MKRFVLGIILFLSPFLIPIILYLLIDPYKVLYKYKEQINTDKTYQVAYNRDFQTTQLFLYNYKKYKYDSFILGNSRSFFYQTSTWNKYIKGNPFHFNASNESIYGINCKLKFLDDLKVEIRNVLIVIDAGALQETKNGKGHLIIKHPALSKESYVSFHIEMFKGFFPKAIFPFTDLYFTGRKKQYMNAYGITNKVWTHDTKTNQLTYYVYDQQINKDPQSYYSDKMSIFYDRDTIQKFSEPVIFNEQAVLLKSISEILKSHKTKYRIIISPMYNQIKLNPQDLNYLKDLFGAEKIFDFSGINKFTADFRNYYEDAHYRPCICDSIMKTVYSFQTVNQ